MKSPKFPSVLVDCNYIDDPLGSSPQAENPWLLFFDPHVTPAAAVSSW
ncbi:MAG: hypothetical protein WA510_22115 [Acidobacteriaceae bacterium]